MVQNLNPNINPSNGPGGSVVTGSSLSATDRGFVPAVEEPFIGEAQPTFTNSLVHWRAVLAGCVVSISLLILSTSLAYAAGVPGYVGQGYGWSTGLWQVISAFICFYIGGMAASYLSPSAIALHGTLRGIACWALAVPLIVLFFGGVTGLLGFGPNGVEFMRSSANAGSALANSGMINHNSNATGTGWGTFLSLALGLVAAAIGGSITPTTLRENPRLRGMTGMSSRARSDVPNVS